jgi:hypothetical protein
MATIEPVLANCGLLGWFADNDYCIACADKTIQQNICPGGERGMRALQSMYPKCVVTYFNEGCQNNPSFSKRLLLEDLGGTGSSR